MREGVCRCVLLSVCPLDSMRECCAQGMSELSAEESGFTHWTHKLLLEGLNGVSTYEARNRETLMNLLFADPLSLSHAQTIERGSTQH